jgi:hypothetical protein
VFAELCAADVKQPDFYACQAHGPAMHFALGEQIDIPNDPSKADDTRMGG